MSELSRLRWRCRRGMKELDVVMSHYLDTRYSAADGDEQQAFEALLGIEDPELYQYIIGNLRHPDPKLAHVIDRLRNAHA